MNSSSPENPNGKKYSPVFIYSAIVVAIVVLLGAFLPEQFNYVTNNIKMWITEKLGWYYFLLRLSCSSVYSLFLVLLENLN